MDKIKTNYHFGADDDTQPNLQILTIETELSDLFTFVKLRLIDCKMTDTSYLKPCRLCRDMSEDLINTFVEDEPSEICDKIYFIFHFKVCQNDTDI